MQMAVAEAIEFPSIPTKVTYNEYIEIAKFYSTDKSSVFINGILDKIFQHLKDTNKIVKQGRGLIGEE
jgi:N utilization substance protein B